MTEIQNTGSKIDRTKGENRQFSSNSWGLRYPTFANGIWKEVNYLFLDIFLCIQILSSPLFKNIE